MVEDLSGLHGDVRPVEGESEFVISQVSFGAPVSPNDAYQVCNLIVSVVSELVDAQPQVYELVRDRTFARTLH